MIKTTFIIIVILIEISIMELSKERILCDKVGGHIISPTIKAKQVQLTAFGCRVNDEVILSFVGIGPL